MLLTYGLTNHVHSISYNQSLMKDICSIMVSNVKIKENKHVIIHIITYNVS